MKTKAVIIAAGEGTRMKSDTNKVMHKIIDKPMLDYQIEALEEAGINEVVVVVGSMAEQIMDYFPNLDYVFQKERLGTGHAVMMAKDEMPEDYNILVMNGDLPLITAKSIKELLSFHKDNDFDATLTTVDVDNPFGYGRIIRKDNGFDKIVEHKDTTIEEREINEINVGLYCYKGKHLKSSLDRLDNDNAQNEYYLTDTIEILKNDGLNIGIYKADNPDQFYGINDRVQLYEAMKIMQRRINKELMLQGVGIIDMENTYISKDVEIGENTTIYPGVRIIGNTKIGKNCTIEGDTLIEDSIIGDSTIISKSTISNSTIGDNVNMGPYTYIRPDSAIGNNVRLGNFVEVKNANIGDGTKASHLTYIGDADVGKNINFGCGTIIVNYDGKKKHRTIIKDNAFIGCNSNLIAPVTIEEGAYIAAGSTITDDVPKNSLAIARARQTIKENWTKK